MFSHHAQLRMQTRRISPDLVESITMNADTKTAVGDNCALLRVSRAWAKAINIDDRMGRYGVIGAKHRPGRDHSSRPRGTSTSQWGLHSRTSRRACTTA